MKTIPPPCPEPEAGPKYWRSMDQLADTPEFRQWLEREFPAGAGEFTDPVSRRHFVKIMSASFLLAGLGLTGCRRPEERILPFGRKPEGYTHGVPQFYATAMPSRAGAIPLLAKSNDGRPTKVEGNPLHPSGNGSTDAFSQASVLNLYDPDRAMRFTHEGRAVTRGDAFRFLDELAKKFQGSGGAGLGILMERSSSPSRERLQKILAQSFPRAKWHLHEPVDFDIHRQAASVAFGQSVVPQYDFARAQRILSLDCDFLGGEEDTHQSIRGFAQGRRMEKPQDEINRLYVMEGLYTVTGANADHRLILPTSQVLPAAAKLAAHILGRTGGDVAEIVRPLAQAFQGDETQLQWLAQCAEDLAAPENRGKSLIVAGQRQPLAVHLMAHALNQALGNIGQTIAYRSEPQPVGDSIQSLAEALNKGQVETLVIVGANPVYNAPADLDWSQAQKKAQTVVRLGYYEDETAALSTWHLPAAHYLESWGDARTGDGTLVPVQPLIEPLFGGITELELLARLGGLTPNKPYEIVRETFQQRAVWDDFEGSWKKFLHDGYLAGSAPNAIAVKFDEAGASRAMRDTMIFPAPGAGQYEVVFHRDYSMDDGRYNNNGWLQETPDPITKVVWENVIMLSASTARALKLTLATKRFEKGLESNDRGIGLKYDILEIEAGGRKIQGPVWIQPGLADNQIALALGYGRERTGRVGQKSGYNAYLLRTTAMPHVVHAAKISQTGRTTQVVTTQEHGSLEGRPIVREANLDQFRAHPDFAKNMDIEAHAPNAGPIYKHPYDRYGTGKEGGAQIRDDRHQVIQSDVHQWGMVIDLNGCVGCNACVVACQSENNVPIVGKDQVWKGREMHWLRIDRYYAGDVSAPQVANQPMLCQHCESAPCESVCPVNATVHDAEGLNVMAYNRCVGTRYCSNNCAWKVRRFNFFDYNKRPLEGLYKGPLARKEPLEYDLIKLSKNPDVTVRMRGVMEKCTFCTQRIEQAKIAQKVKAGASDDIRVPEGTFTTACAQACPAGAIVFGNLLDPDSQVSKLKQQQRNYAVLGFLDTRPRLTYLARVRNPNPRMPDYHQSPLATADYIRAGGNPFKEHAAHHGKTPASGTGAEKKGAH